MRILSCKQWLYRGSCTQYEKGLVKIVGVILKSSPHNITEREIILNLRGNSVLSFTVCKVYCDCNLLFCYFEVLLLILLLEKFVSHSESPWIRVAQKPQ